MDAICESWRSVGCLACAVLSSVNRRDADGLASSKLAHENETKTAVPSCHGRRFNRLNTQI